MQRLPPAPVSPFCCAAFAEQRKRVAYAHCAREDISAQHPFGNRVTSEVPHAYIRLLHQLDRARHPLGEGGAHRGKTARELARKLGVKMKHLYLTSGDSDLICIMEAPSADNIAKFAMAISSLGNVRTRTAMAWSETEYEKLVSELP
jgi:uncharacterized protein with GYD domain